MGVKSVKPAGRKAKATPKKATPKKKPATPKKVATPSKKATPGKEATPKPETKANNVATPKVKPVKSKPTPKKKIPKKKPVSNNTPVKKELNNTAPTNDVPAGRRKRGAGKIENDVPAKKAAKEKTTTATPATNAPVGRGRRGAKANNVATKAVVAPSTPIKAPESTPAKATNNTDKKQSNPKKAKKSPAKAKKSAAPKTPKKPRTSAAKLNTSSAKVSKAKASGGKRAKRAPATKTKSVLLNPVVEIEPLEHTDIKQAKINPKVVLPRIDIGSEVRSIKSNPVILLRRVDLYQKALRNFTVLLPRLHIRFPNSIRINRDTTEDDSPQNNKQIVPVLVRLPLPEIDTNVNSYGNNSTDVTPSSHEVPHENDWLNKKYKPYMEKIKNLSYDEISNFVKNNKEHYEKIKDVKKTGKGSVANSDTKDLFKCNPFNSEQQLAMYLTLRELFNVPETHFKQCRSFFTTIMPEIACQLFAQTFNIKVNSAPRLIKKLYPDPTSPF